MRWRLSIGFSFLMGHFPWSRNELVQSVWHWEPLHRSIGCHRPKSLLWLKQTSWGHKWPKSGPTRRKCLNFWPAKATDPFEQKPTVQKPQTQRHAPLSKEQPNTVCTFRALRLLSGRDAGCVTAKRVGSVSVDHHLCSVRITADGRQTFWLWRSTKPWSTPYNPIFTLFFCNGAK